MPNKHQNETESFAEAAAAVTAENVTEAVADAPVETTVYETNGTMNTMENVQEICDTFIANRDALRKAVKLENITMHVLAADILTTAGVTADADKLKSLRKIISKKVSSISYLVFRTELPLLAALYLSEDPEAAADKINRIYDIMKKRLGRSFYVAMLSILFSRTIDEEQAAQIAERGKVLYDAFQKKHPIITSDRDIACACLLALSDKTDEQILEECEAAHFLLKNAYSDSCFPQFCAYILCMTDGIPEDKATRLMELFFALKASKKKYLTGHEMGVLAALSLTDLSTGELMDTVIDIEAFLSKQKDYGVLEGFDEKRRLMNAAMIATAAYGDRSLTAVNIMAAIVALAAEQDDDDAAITAAMMAAT